MGRDDISDQKPTIAHIMPWAGVGGLEIATLRMTEVTSDRFRHIAFCLDDAVLLRDSFEKIGIETITYVPPEPSLLHGGRFYKESLTVAGQLRSVRADVVHFSETKAAYHNSLAALLARTRMVCHVRNTYPDLSLREKLSLLPVHSFIFVSHEARRGLPISLSDKKARVIYDAIDIPCVDIAASNESVRRELGIPPGCIVVGMVARVNPQKDYYTLVSAAAEVLCSHPDTRFLVVGDNSFVDMNRHHYAEVMSRLKELGIADNFIFTGHRSDVTRLIAAMDISVLSTHREGFGLCIAESMAMQKPVVATAVGGLLEVVEHDVTGYLHQHGNSNELANAIISLIENPDKASQLGWAGYEHVRQNYSRHKFVDEISKAYSDVLRR
jgi:glycosyltransferase involved in cell wall biosynthesis